MNYNEFIKEYDGKSIDYDGGYGAQCVDLIKLYLDKVFDIKIGAIGNAHVYYDNYDKVALLKNNFDRIENTPEFIPQKGDIVVWNKNTGNGCGHVAIATGEGTTTYFYSYDQNWGGKTIRRIYHNYTNVSGVLRAKDQSKLFPKEIEIRYFDANLYNMLYVDLQNAFGGNSGALKEHYKTYGIKEGRVAGYIFDPVFYLNKYEDLKNAFGNDYAAAYNHFLEYGINEGRQANKIFDVKYYLENNADLKQAFGTDYGAGINHFLAYGINEWRATSNEFNVNTYKENYVDLRNAYEENCASYYMHYICWGQHEDRKTI